MGLSQQIAYSSLLAFFPAMAFVVGALGLFHLFDDVKRHARERKPVAAIVGTAAQIPLPDFSKWGAIDRQPMNAVRRATARQMAYAWTIPAVTQNDKADVTSLEQLRRHYGARAEQAGGKLTTTAIALKIVAGALKVFEGVARHDEEAAPGGGERAVVGAVGFFIDGHGWGAPGVGYGGSPGIETSLDAARMSACATGLGKLLRPMARL